MCYFDFYLIGVFIACIQIGYSSSKFGDFHIGYLIAVFLSWIYVFLAAGDYIYSYEHGEQNKSDEEPKT